MYSVEVERRGTEEEEEEEANRAVEDEVVTYLSACSCSYTIGEVVGKDRKASSADRAAIFLVTFHYRR